jgi:hypothetical protein
MRTQRTRWRERSLEQKLARAGGGGECDRASGAGSERIGVERDGDGGFALRGVAGDVGGCPLRVYPTPFEMCHVGPSQPRCQGKRNCLP